MPEKKYEVAYRIDETGDIETFEILADRMELTPYGMTFYNDKDQMVAQVPQFVYVKEYIDELD